jgi:hypothetical protein
MSDKPDSMVIRYLRQIDVKLDRLIGVVGDLNGRMTGMEASDAGASRGLDRIETRLYLVDPARQANA